MGLEAQSDQVASAYDRWAQTYEAVDNLTRDLSAAALRRQVLNLSDRDVLEIGCGTGLNTKYLAERSGKVIAADFSAGMLERARLNVTASNVRFVQSDIRLAWPVESASIDLIVCALVLEHIEKLDHIFAEALRVLRAGGELLIYELHPFRQLMGGQAQFKDTADQVVLIPAYRHSVSDFVNGCIGVGMELVRLEELSDPGDKAKSALPRLLSVHARVPRD